MRCLQIGTLQLSDTEMDGVENSFVSSNSRHKSERNTRGNLFFLFGRFGPIHGVGEVTRLPEEVRFSPSGGRGQFSGPFRLVAPLG